MRTSKTNLSVIDNTGARVQPKIVVGDGAGYKSGDILDANAVVKEVQKGVDKINKADTNAALDKVEEFSTFLADVDNTKTLGELLGALDSRLLSLENADHSVISEYEIVDIIDAPGGNYMCYMNDDDFDQAIEDIQNGKLVYVVFVRDNDTYKDLITSMYRNGHYGNYSLLFTISKAVYDVSPLHRSGND